MDTLRIRFALACVFLATTNVGCCPIVRFDKLDEQASASLQKRVKVYMADAQIGPKGEPLGAISAVSCMKHEDWDAISTDVDAIHQLRIKAMNLGADAVIDVVCERPEGASLSNDCWNSVACHGLAIAVNSSSKH